MSKRPSPPAPNGGRSTTSPIATGVFAFEGNWELDLRDSTSVLTLLRTLQEWADIDCIRRDIGTDAELRHYIDRWLDDCPDHQVGYFGFHGSAGSLWLDNDQRIRLADLEEMIDGRASGRVIHFCSCSVMRAGSDRVDMFRKRTGARERNRFDPNELPSAEPGRCQPVCGAHRLRAGCSVSRRC